MLILSFSGFACNRSAPSSNISPSDAPTPTTDITPTESTPGTTRNAIFAGGCFWCTEAVFEQLKGVSAVVSGYAGGSPQTANYDDVSSGRTEHAEAIRITYDPAIITYGQLLKVFFTVAHDPTQLNRQGPDHGTQYRSAIFYQDTEEKEVARQYIEQLEAAKIYDKPIVTTLEPLTQFHEAEAYHQDYVQQHPNQPYVRYNALPKVDKTRTKYSDLIKE